MLVCTARARHQQGHSIFGDVSLFPADTAIMHPQPKGSGSYVVRITGPHDVTAGTRPIDVIVCAVGRTLQIFNMETKRKPMLLLECDVHD